MDGMCTVAWVERECVGGTNAGVPCSDNTDCDSVLCEDSGVAGTWNWEFHFSDATAFDAGQDVCLGKR
jgi:hypothetical protein